VTAGVPFSIQRAVCWSLFVLIQRAVVIGKVFD